MHPNVDGKLGISRNRYLSAPCRRFRKYRGVTACPGCEDRASGHPACLCHSSWSNPKFGVYISKCKRDSAVRAGCGQCLAARGEGGKSRDPRFELLGLPSQPPGFRAAVGCPSLCYWRSPETHRVIEQGPRGRLLSVS